VQIILLKPPTTTEVERQALERRFAQSHKVHRSKIEIWLRYLKANHPAYADIEIDEEALHSLPEGESVHDQFVSRIEVATSDAERESDTSDEDSTDESDLGQGDTAGHEEAPMNTSACVPARELEEHDRSEIDILRENLQEAEAEPAPAISQSSSGGEPAGDQFRGFSMATISDTPLNEWKEGQHLFAMAFPTLFPRGIGDLQPPNGHRRPLEVTIMDWARHLLKYKDGRFGRHKRFRYVAFNMHYRRTAGRQARYATKKITRPGGEGFDEDYLRELVETGNTEQLSSLIARAANEVPGTRPFWNNRRNQLESMVRGIDCPHLFFTFSAADMQWPDLHRHMPSFGSIQARAGPETYRTRNEDLSNNPHIAAAWLKKRFEVFFKEVIKKKFNVTDHWYRFEWQQRGSGHIHGFLWLADAPKPSVATAEFRDALAQYWGVHVTATTSSRIHRRTGILRPAGKYCHRP
jgi:helitron helicase-like protein/uncharacterized protein DUF6570